MDTMAEFYLLLLIFIFPLRSTRGELICDSISCGEIDIHFPFSLKGANQSNRCSYPRFQLYCDNHGRTILTLSGSGDLVVKSINYEDQTIQVNDPDGCLAKRFLQNNLSHSVSPPFMFDDRVYELYDLTFLHCPSNITKSYPLPPISCLSNVNYSTVIFSWWSRSDSSSHWNECEVISSATVPIPNPNMATSLFSPDLSHDIQLKWNKPECGVCATLGQVCGFTDPTSLQVGCFSSPNQAQDLSRSAKYGLIIGLGIPGFLCIIGLCCCLCGKFTMYTHHRQTRPRPRPSTGFPASIVALQPASFIVGLDGPTIEKFPKTIIGDSGRLPNSNDNTCPICLSKYEPKETLRTIPACSHYFHAHCIHEWLKMNATCPLCRNSLLSINFSPSSSS